MRDPKTWYSEEIFFWRTSVSILWTLIIQFLAVIILLFISTIDVFHPTDWLLEWLNSIFSLSTWGFLFVITCGTAAVSYANVYYYSVIPLVLATRLAWIWNIIRPQRIFHALCHCYLAGLCIWWFLSAKSGWLADLTVTCAKDSEKICLNEYHLLVVLHAVYTGGLYSFNYFLQNLNYMPFPIIQQPKFFQIKSLLSYQFVASVQSVLQKYPYFYFFFHFFGFFLKTPWCELSGINLSNDHSIGVVHGLFNLPLWWAVLSTGVLVHFIWHLTISLFHIYNTEPLMFPIESLCEDTIVQRDVLSCSTLPLLQYLGFQDLSLMVQHSPKSVQQIFSLSQPGGHPYNWKSVYTACIGTIESLTESLIVYNNKASSAVTNGSTASQNIPPASVADKTSGLSPKYQSLDQTYPSIKSPGETLWNSSVNNNNAIYQYPGMMSPEFRYRGYVSYDAYGSAQSLDATGVQVPVQISFWVWLKYKLQQIWLVLKKKPLVAYFVNDLPDAISCQLFVNVQLQIWAIDALSHLTSTSFKEDKYGVVQQSLSDIIKKLLDLQQASKKHFKLSFAPSKKSLKESKPFKDINALRTAFRATIKAAIYRIVATFGSKLSHVELTPEYRRQLKQFLEYKE